MKTFRVRSGDMDWTGEADDAQGAVRKALDESKPRSLGQIIQIDPDGIEDTESTLYTDTVARLKEFGMWGDKDEQ